MTQQQLLKVGTLLVGIILAVLIGARVMKDVVSGQSAGNRTSKQNRVPDLSTESFGGNASLNGDQSQSSENVDSLPGPNAQPIAGSLRLGRIGATPTLQEIQSLRGLPLLDSQINRAYSLAKETTCRMLTPGAAVTPSTFLPEIGQSGTVGRIPAITIGLKMDPSGRSKLPAVTRGQVDEYFAKHRLSIQPTLHADENGGLYFGTDCLAAFYEIDRPGIAIKAEPMIESAVGRFRSLGIAAAADATDKVGRVNSSSMDVEQGRTLVMAFAFEKANLTVSALGGVNQKVTELLLFHLPPSQRDSSAESRTVNARNPISIEVYLTSDARRTLHRLDLDDRGLSSPEPHILADVRFDKMILMGMYPAEPVVTDIRYRSAGVISMELVSELLSGYKQQASTSLDEVLDQFGLLSRSRDAKDSDSSIKVQGTAEDDAQWLKEVARQKYERLERSLKAVPRDTSATE